MDLRNFLRPLASTIEWPALRFPGESVLRQQVDSRADLSASARLWCDPLTLPVGNGAAFAGGLRAAAVAPAFARLSAMLRELLQLDVAPEISVFPSGEWFAEVLPAEPGASLRIAVSSLVVQSIGVREALFVVGRRIARRLFNQYAFLTNPTAGKASPPKEQLLLRGLWKFQELTADRIGLICCQDVEVACRVVLRSASGLPDELLILDWDELLANRSSEEEAMIGDDLHEFSLLRLAALRQFAFGPKYAATLADHPDTAAVLEVTSELVVDPEESIPELRASTPPLGTKRKDSSMVSPLAAEAVSPVRTPAATIRISPEIQQPTEIRPPAKVEQHSPTPAPAEKIEKVPTPVASSSTSMPPALSDESTRKTFTLWASLWVLGARESLTEETRAELWEIFGSEAVAALDEIQGDDGDERCARHCARLAPRMARASIEIRIGIVEDLMHLALADSRLAARERARIQDLAELLDLSTDDVASVAAEFVDPEFAGHRFSLGDEVEVKFDDQWTAGTIHQVEATGDLRVLFPEIGQVYWLNPTADLIRPMARNGELASTTGN